MFDTSILIDYDELINDEHPELSEVIKIENKYSQICYYCIGTMFCLCTFFGIIIYILIFLTSYN